MRSTRRLVNLATSIVCLSTLVLAGCGSKNKTSTDPAELPEFGTGSSTSGSDTGNAPPLPPLDDTRSGLGSGSDSAFDELPPMVLDDVNFEFDRYTLTPEARTVLAANARMLDSRPEAGVRIEGHTDERGTIEYNLALGEKRAQSVKDYLVRYGIENGRLATVSFGEERPLDPSSTEDAWAKNRRAHLRNKQ